MSFAQTLHQIVEDCGGGVAAVLIGRDGLPIEQVESPDPERSGLLADIGVAGVEFGRLVEEARKAFCQPRVPRALVERATNKRAERERTKEESAA